MILMAGDALSRNFPGRAVTGHAVGFDRHQNIGGSAALPGMVTLVTFDTGVFGVIKIGAQHPAIDQDRLGDDGRTDRDRLYLMTEPASGERGARWRSRFLLRLVWISRKKNAANQLIVRSKLISQLSALLLDKSPDLPGVNTFRSGQVLILSGK